MASLRKFSAVLLGLMALNACTFWTRDFERIVDQSGRDFTIDPDKHYKQVDLSDLAAHPSSYKLMDVRFQAILNRHDLMRLIAMGCPEDEYEPEVERILPKLRSARAATDVEAIVQDVFIEMFSERQDEARVAATAQEIWVTYTTPSR